MMPETSVRPVSSVTASTAWVPVWAMPNLSVDAPIETTFVSLVPADDDRVVAACGREAGLSLFLAAFKDEFGKVIRPSLLMYREDAPERVRTSTAIASFRDAVSMSVIPLAHARTMVGRQAQGIQYSDAFDAYPWTLRSPSDTSIVALTAAVTALHKVDKLQAQSAPALGERRLQRRDVDEVLLEALLTKWGELYAGVEAAEHVRLFRALDMARAASRMPGGSDRTIFDEGRSVALWISAFEILVRDDTEANLRKVLELVRRVEWKHGRLDLYDRPVGRRGTMHSNLAGAVYERLYRIRNDFLHGNPVTPDSLVMACGIDAFRFAAPLFRFALMGHMGMRFDERTPDALADPRTYTAFFGRYVRFHGPQETLEKALLLADPQSSDVGEDDW